MAAQDLPPGLTDRYYAPPATATPVPSVAAVRASGLPMAAALSNGTVTPAAPANAVVPIPPLAEKAGLLAQRAINGMRSLIGMAPLGATATPTPTPIPLPPPPAPAPPPVVASPPPNNFYQAKVQQQAQPLTASAY